MLSKLSFVIGLAALAVLPAQVAAKSPYYPPPPRPCKGSVTVQTPSTPTVTDDCSTRTVCVDAINECGIRFGGCIPDCRPWKLTTPPCPTSTTMATYSVSTECATGVILCKDYIDDCGQMYGGCFDTCSPEPTWFQPACTPTTGAATATYDPVPTITDA